MRDPQTMRRTVSATIVCLLACILTVPTLTSAQARTITTTYSYNDDGALTALTKEENGKVETTYVTWDNFVPNASDPTTGTARPGTGTMTGFGSNPGAMEFEFDARDRLVAYNGDNVEASYGYLADGTMSL
jgi:YD repeat-containing protein